MLNANEEQDREKYWIQKLKAASDTRIKELAGWGKGEARQIIIPTTATREELEVIAAKKFVAREEYINNTEYVDNEVARPSRLSWLRESITELSWEEEQAKLKEDYEDKVKHFGDYPYYRYKHECMHCKRVFYSKSDRARYCTYRCDNDNYIKKRRELHGFKRWKGKCQYCSEEFVSSRVDAKYCCPSHRVLACLKKKKKKKKKKNKRESDYISPFHT